jgi:hypothetical protein
MDGNDGDAYGREPHHMLNPDQFSDFIGPLGSYGDPAVPSTGIATTGVMAGV